MTQQCLGTTKSGERCRMTGNFTDGYCHLHRKQQSNEQKEPSPPPPPPQEKPEFKESAYDKPQEGSNNIALIGLLCLIAVVVLLLMNRKRNIRFIPFVD